MQSVERGHFLMLAMFALWLSLYFMQWIWSDLSDVLEMTTLWTDAHQQTQQLFAQSLRLIRDRDLVATKKFDYAWDYLGAYSCVLLCQPQCVSTDHWLLKLRLAQQRIHWRIAFPQSSMNCQQAYTIKLKNPFMSFRKIYGDG